MTRIRTIKPEFWTDEKVVELSAFARLLFIGIWNFCDDEGRMVYSPRRIKMQIFPADALDIEALFDELTANGLVQVYGTSGSRYLQVRGFARHQKIDKRSASRLPPPPDFTESLRSQPPYPKPAESPRIPPPEGKGMEGKGEEGIDSEADASGAAPPSTMSKPDLWAAGKSLLQDAGMPARQCGSFVGKLARDFGNEVAMEALRAAVQERPADPMAYLTATCQRLAGQRHTPMPWYASEQGVLAKGSEVGLHPHPGESMNAFKARIEMALARGRDPPTAVREQRSRMLKASLKRCEA